MSAVEEYKRVCAIVRGKEYWAVGRSEVADAADAALAELGAELASLRDRRCDGCANWDPDEHTYGWCETVLDEDNPIATRPDFACNRFLPR